MSTNKKAQWQELLETEVHGHVCECETSISLANHAHLVQMGKIPEKPALSLGRTAELSGTYTALDWYANCPEHYAGDAEAANLEKGIALRQVGITWFAGHVEKLYNQ
jgi:creatinine amidohydrolase/Fe(II)-dependent formamide hydrolase-like protein